MTPPASSTMPSCKARSFEKMLSPQERESLLDFFRDGFLDRIERNVTSLATADAGERLDLPLQRTRVGSAGDSAQSWWTLDQLVYLPGENPIFGHWTEDRGPGGPYLDSTYGRAWQSDNCGARSKTHAQESKNGHAVAPEVAERVNCTS